MNKFSTIIICFLFVGCIISSCNEKKEQNVSTTEKATIKKIVSNDKRISLALNAMQKQHQLINMRSHLEAVQNIITLIGQENFDKASEVAYNKLGSTTEMKLMCASFGNKEFENLGLNFHKSADEMSEIFKSKDKNKSLEALSNTLNFCVNCHATFRQ